MKTNLNCILVIDDERATNFISQYILEKSGRVRHIKIVESAQEGLDYLSKCDEASDPENYPLPDLILLDINMPVMDGWEFMDAFKLRKEDKTISIVMLTSSIFPDDKRRAEEIEEIFLFENKPLTVAKIDTIIWKLSAVSILKQQEMLA